MPKTLYVAKESTRIGQQHARKAGLVYTSDEEPGITRSGSVEEGFVYRNVRGRVIRDASTLQRIRKLAIPPAYTDVWICPLANGHLQATGKDARGRKQYRYHADWKAVRDDTKFTRLLAFGKVLPSLRDRVEVDMRLPGLPREKVLATVIKLLETTLIRVGNREYQMQNKSFGLSTLQDRHVVVEGSRIRFRFLGKSKVRHDITLSERRLASIVRSCQDLPGQQLFQYLDEQGQQHPVTSTDVNQYLREITGKAFTAKDFRTWAGTVLATLALQEFEAIDSATAARHNIVEAVSRVAQRLGNTPTVCRKSYIHPAVLDSYLEGSLLELLEARTKAALQYPEGLKPEEGAVLALLAARLKREKAADRARKVQERAAS